MKLFFILFIHILFLKCVWSWEWFENAKDAILGERCTHRWLAADVQGLKNEFKSKLFGQPFLEGTLLPLMKKHLGVGMPEGYVPKKALALSFHGSPGVGKTFTSQLIAKHLFREGEKSIYYRHFSLGSTWLIDEKTLRQTIVDTVYECDRAVFVFDEIEKMSDGIFEVIKSFLDFHTHIENVDYRKSIFIFISNIGMERINNLALSLWKQGLTREKFKLSNFEKALHESIYNESGGLKKTMIVKNFLIDLYLPFLPLEKSHIKKCIAAEASALNIRVTEDEEENIMKDLIFLPKGEELYSSAGCKPVSSLILRHSHDEL